VFHVHWLVNINCLNTTLLQKEPGQDLGHADIPAPRVDNADNDGIEGGDNSKEDTAAHVRTTGHSDALA
jgi:hypothetical protein